MIHKILENILYVIIGIMVYAMIIGTMCFIAFISTIISKIATVRLLLTILAFLFLASNIMFFIDLGVEIIEKIEKWSSK